MTAAEPSGSALSARSWSSVTAHAPQQLQDFGLPLCDRYLLAVFDAVDIKERRSAPGLTAVWACAWSSAIDRELLGIWLVSDTVDMAWQSISQDLLQRGLVHIDVQVGYPLPKTDFSISEPQLGRSLLPSLAGLARRSLTYVPPRERKALIPLLNELVAAETMRAANATLERLIASQMGCKYPELTWEWKFALDKLPPLYELPQGRRRLVQTGASVAASLSLDLARVVDSHGPFGTPERALAVLVPSLRRGWRRAISCPSFGCPRKSRARGLLAVDHQD